MREAGCKRLVFSSTCAVYGEPAEIPMPETLRTDPVNAYGASKLAVDRMITDECRAHGLGAVSLRYFNVAGASGDARRGPRARDPPHPARAAGRGRQARPRLGVRHRLPDARRHRRARLHPHRGPRRGPHPRPRARHRTPVEHRIYNLGNGTGFSVRQVIEAARAVTGREIPVHGGGPPAGRSGRAGGLVAEDPRRARLGPAQARDRDDDRGRLELVPGAPAGIRGLTPPSARSSRASFIHVSTPSRRARKSADSES